MKSEEQDINLAEQNIEVGSIVDSSLDQMNEFFYGSLDNSNRNQITRRSYKTEDI